MNWKEVQDKAREKLTPVCKVCPNCNGVACRGQLPGMGGTGTGSSFINNYEALAKYKFNLRTLHDVREPELEVELFGRKLELPLILGAVAGAKTNLNNSISENDLVESWLLGAQMSGILAMTGDGPDPSLYQTGIEGCKKYPGITIPVIKPRFPQEQILERIKWAEEAGAIAIGIDIDASALIHRHMSGLVTETKTLAQIQEIVNSTSLPVILKGIMTVDEALLAVEAGAKGIVVSNHGGRALDHCPGTADVLPAIAQAVRDKLTVLVDGGIRNGLDVLKVLALGAHGAVVGRPPSIAAVGGGAEGIKVMVDEFKFGLRRTMILTGTKDVKNVNPRILYRE